MARKNAKTVKKPATTKQVVDANTEVKKQEEPAAPTTGTFGWVLKIIAVVAAVGVTFCLLLQKSDLFVPGCHQENETMCGRALIDNFVMPKQVTQLREIAEIGMQNRSKLGGPTIMDINTGFVRDSEGLVNIYQPEQRIPNEDKPGVKRFSKKQFSLYRG
ncbi:Dynein light chain Tctex-type 1 [Phytophthora nicotianae]|uniref:Dynein light chain Tctex-type 1 n=1 Tax=Phytophthora nicotianae TaxID=4792 RepID=A0A0W8DB17_PHYNI|nr:Dynein light chain Tctex-type 1 [Phytophthora nicotianae]